MYKWVLMGMLLTMPMMIQAKTYYYYFSADWCGYCERLKPQIPKYFTIIDITVKNNREIKLMRQYGVIAPPTLVIVGKNGTKLVEYVGYAEIIGYLTSRK